MSLESGARIILELTEPADIIRQLTALRFYVDQHKDVLGLGEVSYIDVRNIGKIFICADKNICSKNLQRIYGASYK
jgi:hypothetical protein